MSDGSAPVTQGMLVLLVHRAGPEPEDPALGQPCSRCDAVTLYAKPDAVWREGTYVGVYPDGREYFVAPADMPPDDFLANNEALCAVDPRRVS